MYLIKEVECLMQVGEHACGRLVGDLDGGLEDALGHDVVLGGGGGLCADEHAVILVALLAVLLYLLLQAAQPLCHQVHVLWGRK